MDETIRDDVALVRGRESRGKYLVKIRAGHLPGWLLFCPCPYSKALGAFSIGWFDLCGPV